MQTDASLHGSAATSPLPHMTAAAAGFVNARRAMIESQLRPNQVRDNALLDALTAVPREAFLPEELAGVAYLDESIAIAPGRFLLQPLILARLLQAAAIKPGDRVLDIAPGTGYSSALIAALGADVVAVEPDADLHRQAESNIRLHGQDRAVVLAGAPVEGCAAQGPYDVILINGSVDFVPDHLLAQLKPGGRLVCVMRRYGPSHATHTGQAFLFMAGTATGTPLFDAQAPLAPGFAQARGFDF